MPAMTVPRSSTVLAGVLLMSVGLGDLIAGHRKVLQYEEAVELTRPTKPPDPAALFPTSSEGQERHQLARAKLAFYQLLLSAGQLLSALGVVLLAAGMLRLRLRALRAAPGSPAAN
jgi:hypothetical protein